MAFGKNFLFLFASAALLATSNATTTSETSTSATNTDDSTESCEAESTACFADDTCLECITLSLTDSSADSCQSALADDDTTQCGYEAISYCCQSETSSTAACVNDETTRAYWTCVLALNGCDLDDMPCVDAETPAPVTTEGPTTAAEGSETDSESDGAFGIAGPSSVLYAGVLALAAVVGMMV